MDMPETVRVEIAGRVFTSAKETTFEQDLYVTSIVATSGMLNASLDPGNGELTNHAMLLIAKAYEQGNLFRLLAGVLAEEGRPWTKEWAEETADLLSKITDPEDKSRLNSILTSVLLAFFVSGDSFRKNSRNFSSQLLDQSPAVAGEVSTSESGTK